MSSAPLLAYSADTSVLIDLRIYYDPDVFPSLWSHLQALVDAGRFFMPEHVVQECLDQPIIDWIKARPSVQRAFDAAQNEQLVTILSQLADCVDTTRTTPDADPFVVALAMAENRQLLAAGGAMQVAVLTQERPRRSAAKRPKIPDVCNHFGVRWMNLLGLCREEGWQF